VKPDTEKVEDKKIPSSQSTEDLSNHQVPLEVIDEQPASNTEHSELPSSSSDPDLQRHGDLQHKMMHWFHLEALHLRTNHLLRTLKDKGK
jgi:hypothetical protein